MPNKDLNKNPGFVAELKAKIEKQTQFEEAPLQHVNPSHTQTSSTSEVSDYVEYFTVGRTEDGKERRVLSPNEFQASKGVAHQQMAGGSDAELVRNPIPQQLNLPPSSDSLVYADLSLPTSQKQIEKKWSEPTLYAEVLLPPEEVEWATVTIAADETREISYKDQPDQKGDKTSHLSATGNPLDSNESEENLLSRFKVRGEEIIKWWQEPLSEAEEQKQRTQEVQLAQGDSNRQGPPVNRSAKPGPTVNRDLKPSRLAQSSFFSSQNLSSSSHDQEEKEKGKTKKGFAS